MLMVAGTELSGSTAICNIVKSVIDGSLAIVTKNERVPNRFDKPGTRFFVCGLLMSVEDRSSESPRQCGRNPDGDRT